MGALMKYILEGWVKRKKKLLNEVWDLRRAEQDASGES